MEGFYKVETSLNTKFKKSLIPQRGVHELQMSTVSCVLCSYKVFYRCNLRGFY